MVGCLAALGATAHDRPGSRVAAWSGGLVLGGLLPWLALPNPSLDAEFAIDRFLLLPQLAARHGQGGLDPQAFFVSWSLSMAGVGVVLALRPHRALLVRVLLGLMVISFLVASVYANPSVEADTARPPQAGTYTMDAFLYLRVQDLLKQGSGYYRAFYLAYTQGQGVTGEPVNTFNWRPPTLIRLWSLVPGGPRELLGVFRGLVALTLLASFGLARSRVDDGLALWAPALLGAYFLYASATVWFATHEYWAALFMLIGLWGWMSGRPGPGSLFLALAILSRELFAFLLLPLAAFAVLGSPIERTWARGTLVTVGLLYLAHYAYVLGVIQAANSGVSTWQAGGPGFLKTSLQFGTVYMGARNHLWFPLLAAGAAGACLTRDWRTRVLMAWSVLVPLAAFLLIGQEGRFYWGVVAVPQLLAAVPLLGGLLTAEVTGRKAPGLLAEDSPGIPSSVS